MKRFLIVGVVILSIAITTLAFADKSIFSAKVGDEIYVCGCGEGCPCDTMSRNAAKCSCGKDLVKAKVTNVEKGKITVATRTKPFVSIGKYSCACGPECKCDTISQNPGNCSCDKPMVQVKAEAKK